MTQYQAKLRDAKQIQRGLQVPSRELKNFMEYLKVSASEKSSFLPCGGCMRNYIPTDQSFHRAFKFFTKQQKIQYYYRVVQIVKECLESKYPNNYEKKQETKTNYNIFFYNDDEGAWESRAIRIEFEQKKFIFKSTNEEINLGYYILRISKKRDRKSLALESIDDLQYPTTIRVSGHKDLTTDQLKQLLQKLIFDATKEKFKEMINKASAQNGRKKNQPDFRLLRSQSKQMQTNIQRTNSLILSPDLEVRNAVDTKMLNVMPKSIEGDYSFSNKREPSDIQSLKWKLKLKAALNNFENLDEFQKNLYVNIKEKRVRKVYDIKEEEFCFYWEWFIDILMSPSTFKRWKTTLTKAKTLSKKKNQKIIYEQHDFKLFTTSYIYKREVIEQNIDSLFIFDSWAQDPTNEYTSNNKIEYVMWSFQKISRTINVIVEAKISHDASRIASQTFNLIPQFLGDISKVCQNTNISFVGDSNFNVNTILFERQYLSMLQENDLDDSQEFLTIFGDSDKNSSTIRIIQDIQNSEPQYLQILKDVILPDKPNLFATFTPTNRLNYRHPIYPLPKADRPHLKLPKMPGQCPYWQNQFTFNQKGDMISINKQKIKAQSGVLSKILGGMAKNFFSGKSILNMSLPVSIFSKDSNLSLLCKSLAYAPLHLQKAAKTSDPVERMKWVVAFATGCTTAYIQMDKPFNPILGQTYHCMIDGCPVYGEQISHHPPTSAMFMKGRGYTLYGNFQAKVSIGLNTATGSNDGICHISFDEKDYTKNVIKYNYQPGEISGLTFGDRIIHAVGTSCYLDVQNYLFVRLKFGKHKGVTEYCKFFNGIEGELVKLDKKTDLSKFPDIDSSRVVQTYGMFSGRWSQEIYYQGDPIFNSWKEYPYLCEKYPFPLESDAFYRKDLLLKIEDKDQQAAQEAKVELQQIQRNDRKLRAKYHGNKH